MGISNIFDVTRQLTFYGSYHSNRINILIHIICVPLLLWTFQVIGTTVPLPASIPALYHKFNDYLIFDLNFSTLFAAVYNLYYFTLDPIGALLYLPQMTLSVLSATAYARTPHALEKAALINGVSWIAQFIGHGVAEKRAPALLDNILGAVVLAPFFVHLELLFSIGYKPELHRRINNEVGKEITRFRKEQGDKRRAAGKTE